MTYRQDRDFREVMRRSGCGTWHGSSTSPSGRPVGNTRLDDLSETDDPALREMWKDPLIYTPQFCIKWASEKLQNPVRRWQLDYRYGKRNEPTQMEDGECRL